MANEPRPSSPEVDLPKTRSTPRTAVRPAMLAALDRAAWFRPALVAVAAGLVGLVLAPEWATRNYPTDPNLVGTPATADIKAEYDDRGDIIDERTTARLREEAVAEVRDVYDFDAELGRKIGELVRSAAETARAQISSFVASDPAFANGVARLDRRRAAVFAEGMTQALVTAQAAFGGELGVTLTPVDAKQLAADRYGAPFADLLADLIIAVHEDPIILDRTGLAGNAAKGILVRQLTEDTQRVVEDVATVGDLQRVKNALSIRLDVLLAQRQARAMGRHQPRQAPPPVVVPVTPVWRPAPELRTALVHVAEQLLRPNLTFNRRDTETARDTAKLSVAPAKLTVKRGQMIIRDGDVYTERHLLILGAMARYSRDTSIARVAIGAFLLVLTLLFAAMSLGGMRRTTMPARDALFLAALFIMAVVMGRVWLALVGTVGETSSAAAHAALLYLLPVAAGAMVARLVLRLETALVFGVVTSLVLGLMVGEHRLITIYALVGSILGASLIRTISKRSDLLRVGVWVGGAQAVTALGMQLFVAEGDPLIYLVTIGAAFSGGLLAAFIALALTPVIEMVFRYTTDLKLLELANLNHPALKELIVQSPGTYHHSIIVGSLVEAAADAIGANSLLAKVMAYYHDLGKGTNATYFIENQRGGQNPHDKLKPSMSAMIIRHHVSDGLELGKKFGLGSEILAGIAEHHGTSVIQYFYRRAQDGGDEDTQVSESDYRYPGPKPQTRETALVMLSDSVEAAARSLPDPNPARLRGMVNKIINVKFTDGQLEDSELTLKDLHTIAKAFLDVLGSIYHHRVEYPEANKERRRDDDSDPKPPGKENGGDTPSEEDRPDNIRRLGLSGR